MGIQKYVNDCHTRRYTNEASISGTLIIFTGGLRL